MTTIRIPQATARGYIECPVGGVFDFTYPTSKLRRGRVQEGGRVTPTITSSGELLRVISYERKENIHTTYQGRMQSCPDRDLRMGKPCEHDEHGALSEGGG